MTMCKQKKKMILGLYNSGVAYSVLLFNNSEVVYRKLSKIVDLSFNER